MLGRLCTAATTVLTGASLALSAPVTPPPPALAAQSAPTAPTSQQWAVDLSKGNGNNVVYQQGALRLSAPSGLLTTAATLLDRPVGRVASTLDASTPPGSTVEVDVRGLQADGLWSEWLPSTTSAPATLPGPSNRVQVRVLLTGGIGGAPARPLVRWLRLTGQSVPNMRVDAPPELPASYQVIATREGLVAGRTANGHQIRSHDLFVALPSHRALADTSGSEYSVKVCSRLGYCAWAPVWDTGPWNTTDDYWSANREQFAELPQGVPQAQAAFRNGFNGGRDGSGRTVANPAGIDLSDGVYGDILGLSGNAQVTVSYLWTGNTPLSPVNAGGNPAENQNVPAADPSEAALAALAASVHTDHPTTNPGTTSNQDSSNQSTASQDSTNQEASNQGSTNQSTGNQSTSNQSTSNQSTSNQSTSNQSAGGGDPGGEDPDDDTPGGGAGVGAGVGAGSGNSGSGNSGSGNSGSGNSGSGNSGSGNSGSGNSGSGNSGSGNSGSGNSGSGNSGSSGGGKRGNHTRGGSSGSGNRSGDKHMVAVRTAPDPNSAPAGMAADHAGVPVRCETGNGWVQIDPDAYLPAGAVALTTAPGPC